jgi:Ni,Fe-hydrogenase maturation factor
MKSEQMKILVFGNPLVEKDRLPLELMKELQEEFPSIEFKEFDTAEDLQNEGIELNIIDAVEGIKKVELITDIDSLQTSKIFSLHDFDLAYTLKLLKKMKMIDNVKIFGVPIDTKKEIVLKQLKELIKSSLL